MRLPSPAHAIVPGQWYRLGTYYANGASQVIWQIDGVTSFTGTGTTRDTERIQAGFFAAGKTDSGTLHVARVAIDNAAYPGLIPHDVFGYQTIAWLDQTPIYDVAVTDILKLSDPISCSFLYLVSLTDKLLTGDSSAIILNSIYNITDKLNLIETPTSIVTYLTSITDKLNLLESSNLQLVIPLSVNDFLRLSDSSIIALTLYLSTIDKLKLYESRATIHNMLLTTSDSLRLYEHVTSNRTVVMTISDLVNLSENAILTLLTTIIELFLTDLLKLTDTLVTARIVTEYLTDYLHMIESSHNVMASIISISDFLKLTEPRLAWEGATYLLALTDMLKLVESHTNRADYFQHLIDKIKISETLRTIHNMHINLTDIIVLKEHALTPTGEPLIIFKLRAGAYTYALTTKGRIFRLPNMNRTFTV